MTQRPRAVGSIELVWRDEDNVEMKRTLHRIAPPEPLIPGQTFELALSVKVNPGGTIEALVESPPSLDVTGRKIVL